MHTKWILMLTLLLFSVSPVLAGNQKVLYTFTGAADGGTPTAGVIFDPAGNLYGVTEYGGAYGRGVVFKLTAASDGTWNETVIYSFTGGTDGGEPQGGLVIDSAGNLYGTTSWFGDPVAGCGTVFKLSPSASGWTLTTLHAFLNGKDGCSPQADLQLSFEGFLFGTTAGGGAGAEGTAFYVTQGGDWYSNSSFSGHSGMYPGGLGIFPPEPFGPEYSAIYGDTFYGGPAAPGNYGVGNVFELANGFNPYYNRIVSKHSFNTTDAFGYFPIGNLATTQDVNGVRSMFGANSIGGTGRDGTIYRLTQSQSVFDGWLLSVIHSFSGPDGDSPWGGVMLDASGNLYGTTQYGGSDPGYGGTVFKLTPGANNKWTHNLLYSFTGAADGSMPSYSLTIDAAGNLYGTTWQGGTYKQGVVYEVPYSAAFAKPTSLTFGTQPIGTTSAPQRVALLNPSAVPITVTNINVQGDFAVSTNHCQNGIQPKTHCDVYITFTPTGTSHKPRTGSVTFTDTTFNTPQTVALSGTVPAVTKTTLTASPSPSMAGQDVVFTATVTSPQGPVPDGDPVVFLVDGEMFDTNPLSGGMAQIDTPYLEPGPHRIIAQYVGDPAFDDSQATVALQVYKIPTITTLTSIPDPSQHGQAVTFVAVVTSSGPEPGGGLVRFWDGKRSIGGAYLNGEVATFTTSNLAAGSHAITAQFVANGWWNSSTSDVLNQVVH